MTIDKTASYQLTVEDYLEAQQLIERNTKSFWLNLGIIGLCLSQVIICLVRFRYLDFLVFKELNFYYEQSNDELYRSIGSYALCFFAYFGMVFPKLNPLAYWTAEKDLQKNFIKAESKEISITSEGIAIASQNYRQYYQWQAITKTVENNKIFLLYYSRDRECIVIPKRVFNSESELNNFRYLLDS